MVLLIDNYDSFTYNIFQEISELGVEVLSVIDKAIPYPIIFQLRYDDRTKSVAAYKRPAADGSGAWVIEEYFESEWTDHTAPVQSLPVALDIKSLYEQIIKISFIDLLPRNGESLESLVERVRVLRKYQRELRVVEAKMNGEKQFNRKVELKAKVRERNHD